MEEPQSSMLPAADLCQNQGQTSLAESYASTPEEAFNGQPKAPTYPLRYPAKTSFRKGWCCRLWYADVASCKLWRLSMGACLRLASLLSAWHTPMFYLPNWMLAVRNCPGLQPAPWAPTHDFLAMLESLRHNTASLPAQVTVNLQRDPYHNLNHTIAGPVL